ncbi:MAG: transcription termination/antitermination NusG family protein [Ferruginibacter sp.]
MQKNWYAVYTKPQCEKKVAALLSKKKIENFCPLACVETQTFRRSKMVFKPLFKSYVFVHVTPTEVDVLKNTDGVVNMLYWLGQPAVIKEDEIEAIKEFTADHKNIELERGIVNTVESARNFSASSYAIDGKLVTIKNKLLKISLPSLGYTMIAKIEDESIFGRESLAQRSTFAHSS